VQLDDETASRLRVAFPTHLRADVDLVVRRLPSPTYRPSTDDIGEVQVQGERVKIPYRIYIPEVGAVDGDELSSTQRLVLACIYTRHHDGHVREKALRQLLPPGEVFVAPFIVQLVGEYVVEIVKMIFDHVDRLKTPEFRRFVEENQPLLARTRQRATSYWDCYYRGQWLRRGDYPGLRVLDALVANDG
jgi:hypothetical protein